MPGVQDRWALGQEGVFHHQLSTGDGVEVMHTHSATEDARAIPSCDSACGIIEVNRTLCLSTES
jgi:hypothetical protein